MNAAVFAVMNVLWTLNVLEYGYSIFGLWGFDTPKNFIMIPELTQISRIIGTVVLGSHFINSAIIQILGFLYIKRQKPAIHKTLSIVGFALTITTSALMVLFLFMTPNTQLMIWYRIIMGVWLFTQILSSLCYIIVYDYDRGYSLQVELLDERDPHLEQAIMNGSVLTPVMYSMLWTVFEYLNQVYTTDIQMIVFSIAFMVSTMSMLFYRIIITMSTKLQPPEKRTILRCLFIMVLIVGHVFWILRIFHNQKN